MPWPPPGACALVNAWDSRREAVKRQEIRVNTRKLAIYEVAILPKGNWHPKEGRKDPKWKRFGAVTIPSKVG